jgi:hypothetical protein
VADIGYYVQVVGGIPGQPDLGNADPVRQAALQQSVFQQNQAIKEAAVVAGVYVPPGTGSGPPSAPEWANQVGGPSNVPIVGWTAQNSRAGTAFVAQPGQWMATDMGTVPDWTSDPNPAAAGSYDMTSPPVYNDFQRADTLQGAVPDAGGGPIGGPFFDAPGAQLPDDPNTSSQFSQGHIGQSLEW